MLDIRFIRENAQLVKKSTEQKGYKVDIDEVIRRGEVRNQKLRVREETKRELNEISGSIKGDPPSQETLGKAKEIKERLEIATREFRNADDEEFELRKEVPNIIPDDTPIGGEDANREEKKWGDTADKSFEVKDHQTWAEEHGLLDFERGAKVAGSKFYFSKASLVELELALAQFSLALVKKQGFWPMGVPHLVNTRTLEGAGFSAKGEEKQVYKIEGEDLNLIATAEIPLTGFFADEIIPSDWLPSSMAGWSPAYRVEAGSYGKHSQGLYRVHQFNKLELYIYCKPENSEEQHQKLLAIEEEICQALNIPYRVVRIASGDLGAPAYKKYDIEYWSPVDKTYRELMSCSNVTDYQARNLNIRYRKEDGSTEFVHTLNATAAAMSRMIIAIIENFQNKEGKVTIPAALQPFMHGQTHL